METVVCKIEGAKGITEWENFKDHIECVNVRWGGARNVRSAMGSSKDRESKAAYMGDITFQKTLDSASSFLTLAFFKSTALGECVFEYIRTDNGGIAYRTITLSDCIMASYASSPGPESRPIETISLNFTRFVCDDKTTGAKNTNDNSGKAIFDLPKGKGS